MDWKTLLSQNRPRESTSNGDHREQFERDYDRAIFSTPVKRLQDKAQVFPLEPHDAIRTRLTHSLEVSSVARGIAKGVAKWLVDEGEIDEDWTRSIEAIAATVGLVHDLGNPPFGHSGEFAIQEWFKTNFPNTHDGDSLHHRFDRESNGLSVSIRDQMVADFRKFEGNAQTIRLVSKLQVLADFNGLNLTFGTLSAMLKYTSSSELAGAPDGKHCESKPGFFYSENDLVDRIRTETGTGRARNPIAFLAEAADDIVYTAADIEDSVKKGVLTWNEIRERIEASATDNEKLKSAFENAVEMKNRILKPGNRLNLLDDRHASAFRTAAISISVHAVVEEFKIKYPQIISGDYKGELVYDGASGPLVQELKNVARDLVFPLPEILRLELAGRRTIQDLMSLFWEGAQIVQEDGSIPKPSRKGFEGKLANLISDNYRKVYEEARRTNPDVPITYHQLQLVTDYVCGMTDSFASSLHRELTNG